ncbi:MAG: hypothetical protein MPJ50_15420 [Pirellulales bacterium]|nr:hypothetical protein [Pirellulales bacterium]
MDYPRGNRRITGELSFLSTNLGKHLSDIIVLLTKEREGLQPAFAIDFEVLHGYLFPAIQKRASRVSSALVGYVIAHWPHRFILPPGGLIELLTFANRVFPLTQYLETLRDSKDSTASEWAPRLREAVDLYQRVLHHDDDESPDVSTSGESVRTIFESASEIATGFKRLNRLLVEQRITSPEEAGCASDLDNEDHTELVSAIAAQLSAMQSLQSRRSRRSNYNDARNIASVLSWEESRYRTGTPSAFFQLLTETRPILRLNLNEYGNDRLAERLRSTSQLMTYPGQPRTAWFATTVSSAALYCSFRNAYGDVASCLNAAKEQYIELAELGTQVLKVDRLFDNTGETDEPALHEATETAGQLLKHNGLGKWYFPLRVALQNTSLEALSLASVEDTFFGEAIASPEVYHAISAPNLHRGHVGDDLSSLYAKSPKAPQSNLLQAFGVSVGKPVRRGHLLPRDELLIESSATNERLLDICRWAQRDVISVRWPVRIDFYRLLSWLSQLVYSIQHCEGRLVVHYDVAPTAFSESLKRQTNYESHQREYPLLGLPKVLPVEMFVLQGRRYLHSERLIQLPTSLSLETEIGDLHVMTAYTIEPEGPSATCLVKDIDGYERVLSPALQATHAWAWSTTLIADCLCNVRGCIQDQNTGN